MRTTHDRARQRARAGPVRPCRVVALLVAFALGQVWFTGWTIPSTRISP